MEANDGDHGVRRRTERGRERRQQQKVSGAEARWRQNPFRVSAVNCSSDGDSIRRRRDVQQMAEHRRRQPAAVAAAVDVAGGQNGGNRRGGFSTTEPLKGFNAVDHAGEGCRPCRRWETTTSSSSDVGEVELVGGSASRCQPRRGQHCGSCPSPRSGLGFSTRAHSRYGLPPAFRLKPSYELGPILSPV